MTISQCIPLAWRLAAPCTLYSASVVEREASDRFFGAQVLYSKPSR